MSKFLFDSMLPKYTQFQPFISSQISSSSVSPASSVGPVLNQQQQQNNHNNLSLQTSASEGSPLNTSEGSPNSPSSITASSTQNNNNNNSKMYPYVSNHPSSHSGLSGMAGFSGLEDKSCRYVY